MNLVMQVLGIISPGAMGSALCAAARHGGHDVIAVLEGRSDRTRARAGAAGIASVAGLRELLTTADVVLSVVPPGEADAVADAVADALADVAARPLYVECNAINPARARTIAGRLRQVGMDCVDASISGPPPRGDGTTVLYLSGARTTEVAGLELPGVVRTVVGPDVGLASAVKMSTASVYKGRVALLAQALRSAQAHGVLEYVLADLERTGLVDAARTGTTLAGASAKAARYVAEMREIAATQADAHLTPGLFEAFATVYETLARGAPFEHPDDVPDGHPLEALLEALGASRSSGADDQRP